MTSFIEKKNPQEDFVTYTLDTFEELTFKKHFSSHMASRSGQGCASLQSPLRFSGFSLQINLLTGLSASESIKKLNLASTQVSTGKLRRFWNLS